MNRSALLWMLAGAMPVALVAAAVQLWPKEKSEGLYLRVVDDNYEQAERLEWEKVGAISAMLVRRCGIGQFETDVAALHHAGSTFVSIDDVPIEKLDCVIGEARLNGLTIAVSRGRVPTTIECLSGRPARFQPPENIDHEALARCDRLRKNAVEKAADERK